MALAYDLCSARNCNICLLLQTEKKTLNGCKGTPPKLHKCSGCQLVVYCNDHHQRLDWPLHRDFCRATQNVLTAFQIAHIYQLNGQPISGADMERTILQVKYLLRNSLGRPLQFHEEELTSFPAYCAVCYSFKRLHHCPNCLAVSYCSPAHAAEHAAQHSRQCGLLQLYYSAYKVHPAAPPEHFIAKLQGEATDLQHSDLASVFQATTQKQLPVQPTATLADYQLFACAADFSCIGTLCYALSFLDMCSYKNSKLVIFIVGTSIERDLWFRDIHTQFLFLQYPQIKQLALYFIGPECMRAEQREVVYSFQDIERTVSYISYCGMFQNFCAEHDIKPSLIIAYNCGFSEHTHLGRIRGTLETADKTLVDADNWTPGLFQMLQTYDLPIIFTSFTRLEADFDYAALLRTAQHDRLQTRVERIFNVTQNPYRDLRPLRNWQLCDSEEIYYRNGYVQAVRTHLDK